MGSSRRDRLYLPLMAKPAAKSKSTLDTLIESVNRLRLDAKQRMSEDEFREMEDKVHQLANKVRGFRTR